LPTKTTFDCRDIVGRSMCFTVDSGHYHCNTRTDPTTRRDGWPTREMDAQKRREELDRQLQERRQRLAEMKLAREQRQKTAGLAPLPSILSRIGSKSAVDASDADSKRVGREQDVEALVASLVGEKVHEKVHVTPKAETPAEPPIVLEQPAKIMYDKNVQTVGDEEGHDLPLIKRIFETQPSKARRSLASDVPQLSSKPIEQPEADSQPSDNDAIKAPLSEAALKQIVSSSEYIEFIELAVRIVERTLHDEFDVLKDYTVDDEMQDGYVC